MRALALAAAMVTMTVPGVAYAASGPKWTPAQLAAFADVVVTGRVTHVTSGWDREVNAIYTYVTVELAEVLKGDIEARRLTIKQLGGAVDGLALSVIDQPTFTVGEDVLLYLEARPRDGTLYTVALWQGKWDVVRGASGQEVATRDAPAAHAAADERQPLSEVRQSAAASSAASPSSARPVTTLDLEAAADVPARASAGFNLLGPFRYVHSPAVDVQAGGQPGLSGGGASQIQTAIARWNNAGAAFRYTAGTSDAAPRCSAQMLNNGRVTITFMDPCGEMSNSGGTLAMGGSYYVAGDGGSQNGQAFDRAIEGFVINNDSATALTYLTNPGCFEDIQTHELGHVLGLHHSSDPAALMYTTISSSSCWNGPRGLGPDDLAGVRFIYGPGGSILPPALAPADVEATATATAVTVTWSPIPDDPAGTAATGYRVEFRSGHEDSGALVGSVATPQTSVIVSVPPGLSGPFNVVVRGENAAGAGPASARHDFTIATGAGPCTGPPGAVTGVTGSVANGFARVGWSAAAGATRYLIQAGTTAGAADLFAVTDLGDSLGAAASVPAGFRAWVRIVAVNACGAGVPTDYLLQ